MQRSDWKTAPPKKKNTKRKKKLTVSHKLANSLEIGKKFRNLKEHEKCYVFSKRFGQDTKILHKKGKQLRLGSWDRPALS
jgi:hypothetical protein